MINFCQFKGATTSKNNKKFKEIFWGQIKYIYCYFFTIKYHK
jgi:hypothetical protein